MGSFVARQAHRAGIQLYNGSHPFFHFGMQIGLSVSSELRALAYSISACRAASHRSALENSWVEITAPFATPSQLTMIRTWVTISSSPGQCLPKTDGGWVIPARTLADALRALIWVKHRYRPFVALAKQQHPTFALNKKGPGMVPGPRLDLLETSP